MVFGMEGGIPQQAQSLRAGLNPRLATPEEYAASMMARSAAPASPVTAYQEPTASIESRLLALQSDFAELFKLSMTIRQKLFGSWPESPEGPYGEPVSHEERIALLAQAAQVCLGHLRFVAERL